MQDVLSETHNWGLIFCGLVGTYFFVRICTPCNMHSDITECEKYVYILRNAYKFVGGRFCLWLMQKRIYFELDQNTWNTPSPISIGGCCITDR